MKTPALQTTAATGPVAAAIALCMCTYHPPSSWPSLKTYTVSLLVEDHLIEPLDVTARSTAEAINRAIDLRRAQAIRERRPDLSIKPWSIARLAA